MVLGPFALFLGVKPYDEHRWHMSMFRHAVDWVSLPNALGMSQYGDGGIAGTQPHAASGNYIYRMSDCCAKCRYDPKKIVRRRCLPVYHSLLGLSGTNRTTVSRHPRMKYPYRNLGRKDPAEIAAIWRRADAIKSRCSAETFL
ncbi:MAG: hypothetical protein HC869_00995 [Rhodospirillales bacterium]|nr:hypothetical protein [Rhodospirillales bacterium]